MFGNSIAERIASLNIGTPEWVEGVLDVFGGLGSRATRGAQQQLRDFRDRAVRGINGVLETGRLGEIGGREDLTDVLESLTDGIDGALGLFSPPLDLFQYNPPSVLGRPEGDLIDRVRDGVSSLNLNFLGDAYDRALDAFDAGNLIGSTSRSAVEDLLNLWGDGELRGLLQDSLDISAFRNSGQQLSAARDLFNRFRSALDSNFFNQ